MRFDLHDGAYWPEASCWPNSIDMNLCKYHTFSMREPIHVAQK